MRFFSDNAENLIFLHIPKAAGSTLSEILLRQYRGRGHFQIHGHTLKEDVDKLSRLSPRKRNKLKFIHGHQFYGLHSLLNGNTTYITMLRQPEERILSHYFYIKSIPSHYLYQQVVTAGMTLEDYVRSGITTELDNGQVRLICGEETDGIPCGGITAVHLEIAKKNIEKSFSVVGLQERFDETLLLMHHALGWDKLPLYRRRNVTKGKKTFSETPKGALSALSETNKHDIELYTWARHRFEDALGKIDNLEEKLEVFRAETASYVEHSFDAKKAKEFIKKCIGKK